MNNTLAFAWSSPAAVDPLDGYALAMIVRLRGSKHVGGDGAVVWKGKSDRDLTPTKLTAEMIPDIAKVYAYIRCRIRTDALKTEAQVLEMVASLSEEAVEDRWALAHKAEVDQARMDLAVLASVGFRCLG